MKPFPIAAAVGLVAVLVAYLTGINWQRVAVAAVFGALVAAMLETMPLRDWLFPKDEGRKLDDD